MALKLIATYSKRLGLPGYSSHQFSVCVETEISSIDDVAGESTRLYQSLQESVDQEIQHTGFVPADGYGLTNGSNGYSPNGNGQWQCTDKQRELIAKLIGEHNLDQAEVDSMAQRSFDGKTVKQLTKLEASTLIEELFELVRAQPPSVLRSRKGTSTAVTNGRTR